MSYVRVAVISLVVSVAAVVQGEPTSTAPSEQVVQEVKGLIKALEADNFAARQHAADKLVEMGKAIHPVLKKELTENEELSAQQKSRIRDILIDDGAIIRLEKTSKFEQDQIEILQEMRTTLVKTEQSYEASSALKKSIDEEELSDEALALFVYSIIRQTPEEPKSEAGQEGNGPPPCTGGGGFR